MISSVEIADRLRDVRKERALNQTDFAKLVGVNLQTQSRYERGATEPSVGYLASLATAGIDVLYVITGERSDSTLSASETALVDAFREIGEADRAAVLQIVLSLRGGSGLPTLHDRQPSYRGRGGG